LKIVVNVETILKSMASFLFCVLLATVTCCYEIWQNSYAQ